MGREPENLLPDGVRIVTVGPTIARIEIEDPRLRSAYMGIVGKFPGPLSDYFWENYHKDLGDTLTLFIGHLQRICREEGREIRDPDLCDLTGWSADKLVRVRSWWRDPSVDQKLGLGPDRAYAWDVFRHYVRDIRPYQAHHGRGRPPMLYEILMGDLIHRKDRGRLALFFSPDQPHNHGKSEGAERPDSIKPQNHGKPTVGHCHESAVKSESAPGPGSIKPQNHGNSTVGDCHESAVKSAESGDMHAASLHAVAAAAWVPGDSDLPHQRLAPGELTADAAAAKLIALETPLLREMGAVTPTLARSLARLSAAAAYDWAVFYPLFEACKATSKKPVGNPVGTIRYFITTAAKDGEWGPPPELMAAPKKPPRLKPAPAVPEILVDPEHAGLREELLARASLHFGADAVEAWLRETGFGMDDGLYVLRVRDHTSKVWIDKRYTAHLVDFMKVLRGPSAGLEVRIWKGAR